MKRALLLLTSLLLLAADRGSSQARAQGVPEQAVPEPTPTVAPAPPDPLEEFVPHEKLEADSVVALPVDI